jgi:LPXTG-motif cell wall-anchored protein
MDTTTVAVGVAFLVALALYLMRRKSRLDKD